MAVTPGKGRNAAHFEVHPLNGDHMYSVGLNGRTHQIRVHMAYIRHPIRYMAQAAESQYRGTRFHTRYLILKHPTSVKNAVRSTIAENFHRCEKA